MSEFPESWSFQKWRDLLSPSLEKECLCLKADMNLIEELETIKSKLKSSPREEI